MAILKKEYELSVWDETLGVKGQKEETKRAIIGAHDMTYDGRATALKLSRKINGTNVLTFQMPSKYFNSELGEYIHNEFCDYIFNERKLKLKYDGEWFEFYVKNISENKQFKSIMYQYQCEDAFIDELSRNGYGITFDTELYNNVEEIGVFTEQILEDSIWEYDASKNWGDFTEYAEEKLFKIPVSMFNKIVGYKLNYDVSDAIEDEKLILTNVFSGETRNLELGDDLSREKKIFWDNGNFDSGISLLKKLSENIPNDGYIYVPYSCLDFCYVSSEKDGKGFAATDEPVIGEINSIKSYYLAPKSIDPTHLIQFIAIPNNAELQIDEAGLIIDKNYSYVMTLADWNNNVNTNIYYDPEKKKMEQSLVANKVVGYEGYLDKIGETDISFGKKISITDRTEINISEDIDQYVTVYNNTEKEYAGMFTSEEWKDEEKPYRICSYEATRMIVPQLAQNLIQNGTNMTDTSGWEVMKTLTGVNSTSASISVRTESSDKVNNDIKVENPKGLIFDANVVAGEGDEEPSNEHRTFINFGIVGQEEIISKDQTYVFRIQGKTLRKNTSDNKEVIYEDAEIDDSITVYFGEGGYDNEGDYTITNPKFIFSPKIGDNYFIRFTKNIKNPYFAIELKKNRSPLYVFNLQEVVFSKAYTKGIDFFNTQEVGFYKYTGRDIFFDKKSWKKYNGNLYYRRCQTNEFLSETDVVNGDAYSYKKYFRQQIQTNTGNKDSFMLKSYLNNDIEKNAFDPTIFTEDDIKIVTDYIDLNQCSYYDALAEKNQKDCKHKQSNNGICMYQKYGYCPYLFQTQKHCRKIRTLSGEKSNRFNLTQELSKIFEVYPVYYTEHYENGKIIADPVAEDETSYLKMRKKIFYITEKGTENKLGFRYEKNLSDISRTFNSKEIVTKLYVEDVDSELSKTGLCSIKTAEDNPSRDSYIIDFSYYTMRGLLEKEETEADLYGKNDEDMGYLKQLGYFNGEYDRISNLIINLQDKSYTELQANIEVNLTGIETAQKELNKIKKNMSKYSAAKNSKNGTIEESDTYKNYKNKYIEQKNILIGLIKDTFMTNDRYDDSLDIKDWKGASDADTLFEKITNYGFKKFKENYLDTFKYTDFGMMGQYTAEYLQIQQWKKLKAKYLKDINRVSLAFYKKYEPFLKEGTWSDSNYLSDNSYYHGAKEVAKQGAIPKITYTISVIDLSVLDRDYKVGVADSTYIEDIETFGINQKTGFPNRLKAIISGITYDLDIPTQNSIEIQNYTTQFEDLFQQVTATVQSLSFNENIYKRSSNFTSTKNIAEDSLQGSLLENQLTLIETDEKNISLDQTGQSGSDINNHANQYKLSGEGLFFSNNGGQTWNVGVTPKGINADYIKVGSLDASKISIVDGNYLYFLWDKGGITAYRTPQATNSNAEGYFQDFARFNKYGLSLVENGQIRLRAGYAFGGKDKADSIGGKINNEGEITEDKNIGFYLYNNKGEVIFSTESSENSEDNSQDKGDNNTAKISLKGEMFVTDSNIQGEERQRSVYTYKNKINSKNINLVTATRDYGYLQTNDITLQEKMYFTYSGNKQNITEAFLKKEISKIFASNVNNVNTFFTEKNLITLLITVDDGTELECKLSKMGTDDIIKIDKSKSFYLSIEEGYRKVSKTYCWENISFTLENTTYQVTEPIFIDIEDKVQINPDTTKVTILTTTTENKEKTSSKNYKQISYQYYHLQNNNYILKEDFVYNVDGEYYRTRTQTSETISATNLQTSLFLNNRISAALDRQKVGEYERLFSCVTADYTEDADSETGIINNIFSILKNGELYIGGKVCGTNDQPLSGNTSLKNLPNEIKVIEEFLSVKKEIIEDNEQWGLYLDFESLYDTRTGEDLISTIVQHVEAAALISHRHKILKINAYVPTDDTNIKWLYLPKGTYSDGINLTVPQLIQGMLKGGGIKADNTHTYQFDPVIPYFAPINESYSVPLVCKESYTEYEGGASGGTSGGDGTEASGYVLIDPIGV